jgi:hypothetical protein
MKKTLILLCLTAQIAFGQSTTVLPANNNGTYVIKTALNVPGIQHESPGNAILGTVIKADGVYFQTFNNKPFGFATWDFSPSIEIGVNNVTTMQYATSVGYDSPLISQRKLTGITDAYDPLFPSTNDGTPYCTKIPHGASSAANIASASLIIDTVTGGFVCAEYSFSPGYKATVSFDNTYIYVWNYPGLSDIIRNKPFTILITYQKL